MIVHARAGIGRGAARRVREGPGCVWQGRRRKAVNQASAGLGRGFGRVSNRLQRAIQSLDVVRTSSRETPQAPLLMEFDTDECPTPLSSLSCFAVRPGVAANEFGLL